MKLIKVSYAIEEPILADLKDTVKKVNETSKGKKLSMTDVVRDGFLKFIKKNK